MEDRHTWSFLGETKHRLPRLILSLQKLRVRVSRVREQKKERKREKERRVCVCVCVDPRRGYEAALRIRNRVYTNEVDGVRGGTSFPSVSATSERGREITGTRDRRIGWRMCTQRDWCSAATHWRLSAWKLENFLSYIYIYISPTLAFLFQRTTKQYSPLSLSDFIARNFEGIVRATLTTYSTILPERH